MSYKGTYKVTNEYKYFGNLSNITYRSLWELQVMKWLDYNDDVIRWNSEELVIPYRCKTDGEVHRYFVDFVAQFKNGKVVIIEVKPHNQTIPPVAKKKNSRYIAESLTYAKNISKWEAATEYARKKGWHFQIWDEFVLEGIGVKLLNKKHPNAKLTKKANP